MMIDDSLFFINTIYQPSPDIDYDVPFKRFDITIQQSVRIYHP